MKHWTSRPTGTYVLGYGSEITEWLVISDDLSIRLRPIEKVYLSDSKFPKKYKNG